MLWVGFDFVPKILCSVSSNCVCEAQLWYNWFLDASMSVLISLKVGSVTISVVGVVFHVFVVMCRSSGSLVRTRY